MEVQQSEYQMWVENIYDKLVLIIDNEMAEISFYVMHAKTCVFYVFTPVLAKNA